MNSELHFRAIKTFSRYKEKAFHSMEWNERVSVIGKPGYARMYDNVTIDGIKR